MTIRKLTHEKFLLCQPRFRNLHSFRMDSFFDLFDGGMQGSSTIDHCNYPTRRENRKNNKKSSTLGIEPRLRDRQSRVLPTIPSRLDVWAGQQIALITLAPLESSRRKVRTHLQMS